MSWHVRPIYAEHVQRFHNLVDLHALTLAWLRSEDRPELSKIIPMDCLGLEGASPEGLERALEARLLDAYPEEFLDRLEELVWKAQAEILQALIGAQSARGRAELRARLEQAAWHAGAACAERRWPTLRAQLLEALQDLRVVHGALVDSPFSRGRVVLRSTASEIQAEQAQCAHQVSIAEVEAVAGDLCLLHAHWMRGFAGALNPEIALEYIPQEARALPPQGGRSRCRQRWFFAERPRA